jgi:hypothetical protein
LTLVQEKLNSRDFYQKVYFSNINKQIIYDFVAKFIMNTNIQKIYAMSFS